MFACLVSLFEDAKKWIPVSCRMIGTAINSQIYMITDNTPENNQATNITPTNTRIFQNMPLTNPVVKSTRTSVYSKLKNTNEKME